MNQNVITTLEDVEFAVLEFAYEKNNGGTWGRTIYNLCRVINCNNENLVIDALKLMAKKNYFDEIKTYPSTKSARPRIYDPELRNIEDFIRSPREFYITPNEKAHERYEELREKRLKKKNMINIPCLRIYIDDIDNFKEACQVKPEKVMHLLDKNGKLKNMKEDDIQTAFENILGVKHHKRDWGGEENDLYTSNVIISGNRIAAAFMLKGKGTKKHILQISDCGKNGDQLLRLFQSPAELFVVQFVGEISVNIIKDIEGKTDTKRKEGKQAQYCIINGQDTARILFAYNKIKLDQHL